MAARRERSARRRSNPRTKTSAKSTRDRQARSKITRASAGRTGADVRSDAMITIERRASGGVEVVSNSKVEAFYGDSIRNDIRAALRAYKVSHASVTVDDHGALPFVLSARIEAALRRLGAKGDAAPKRTVKVGAPTARDRVRRSRLYLPGNEPKFMVNAGIHKPDAVILDLEDSVHPAEKDTARLLVRNALRTIDFMGAERMVRINQLPLGLKDLDDIVPESPDLILIPKVESAAQVKKIDAHIKAIQKRAKNKHTVWLMPILESALGIENAYEIASATDTVVALTIGLEDYTADMGVKKTKEGGESLFARARLVNAARAAGVQAIDSVFGDVGDMAGLRAWGERSRAMGYEGMGCIHPRQIKVIHSAYAPTIEEIDKALMIVGAFEEAQRRGLGVVSLGTRMVDPPVVLRALRLVAAARRAGLISDK